MQRSEEIRLFLKDAGWEGAEVSPLAGDASFRRYDRVILNGQNAVLMDAPPEFEDTGPFVAVAYYLRDHKMAAPKILACDFERGFLLLEDLGNDLFKTVLEKDQSQELVLYEKAVDELIRLNKYDPPSILSYGEGEYALPRYDMDLLLNEIFLFSDWYYPALTGKRLSFEKRLEYAELWKSVLAKVSRAKECLVLRDYHAENLLTLENGKIGMLDFQDAVIGHSAYDLVSLLQDARRDVDPKTEEKMVSYMAEKLGRDETVFKEHYAILGAQRDTKIIGIFARLFLRDGKDTYLKLIPRMWGLLERCFEHPALADIKIWMDHEVPDKRDIALKPHNPGPSHAMILAAGLGKRMRPLTNNIPKPLIKVAGKTLLAHSLDALAAAGIKNAVVNKHHYAEQIDQFIAERKDWRPKVTLSDESDELLDSGGGVKKALPLLGNGPFFILNSDMLWISHNQDALLRLATAWRDDMDILMLLVKRHEAYGHDGPGDFHMDHDGRLTFRGDDANSDYFYGGVLIMRPECFDGIDDKIFSLRQIFRNSAAKGRLFGLPHEGSWYHVGTPESVKRTEQLLKGE